MGAELRSKTGDRKWEGGPSAGPTVACPVSPVPAVHIIDLHARSLLARWDGPAYVVGSSHPFPALGARGVFLLPFVNTQETGASILHLTYASTSLTARASVQSCWTVEGCDLGR